jgi:hypothetical protein
MRLHALFTTFLFVHAVAVAFLLSYGAGTAGVNLTSHFFSSYRVGSRRL